MMLLEHVWAVALVVVTLGVALVFGWRQWRYLRRTAGDSEERRVLRQSAARRLVVSVLIGSCGVLIAGPYLTGLDRAVVQIGTEREKLPPEQRPPLAEDEWRDVQRYGLW